jgi:hypothetical protein
MGSFNIEKVKMMDFLIASVQGTKANLIAGWLVISCFISLVSFSKAYSNLTPGFRFWHFIKERPSDIRDHPERYFTAKGLFWYRAAQLAIVLGLVGVGMMALFV